MPWYTYEVLNEAGEVVEQVEIEQSCDAPSLVRHPIDARTLQRVYTPPNLGGPHSDRRQKKATSADKIAQAGFTRYKRDKLTGRYHKELGDSRAPENF